MWEPRMERFDDPRTTTNPQGMSSCSVKSRSRKVLKCRVLWSVRSAMKSGLTFGPNTSHTALPRARAEAM